MKSSLLKLVSLILILSSLLSVTVLAADTEPPAPPEAPVVESAPAEDGAPPADAAPDTAEPSAEAEPPAEEAPAEDYSPSEWALSQVLDLSAAGIVNDELYASAQLPITAAQASQLLEGLEARLAASGISGGLYHGGGDGFITRGDYLDALYAVLGSMTPELIRSSSDADEFFRFSGVLLGDSEGFARDRLCTCQEAMLFTSRTLSYVIDELGLASQGLLWKAEKDGSTVYLLGTVHVDRGTIYPFSRQLVSVIEDSDAAYFEIDFLDENGMEYFTTNQLYSDGSALADHISPELYAQVLDIYSMFGVGEDIIAPFRSWALANEISNLAYYATATEEGSDTQLSTEQILVIDYYVYYKALYEGVEIGQVEGYAYQTDLFNSMPDELTEEYLQACVDGFYETLSESGGGEFADVEQGIDYILEGWVARDEETVSAYVNKDASLENDEFTRYLYLERDENMTDFVAGCLDAGDGKTTLLVVGCGHMLGSTGIVAQLREQGYTVELVPAA